MRYIALVIAKTVRKNMIALVNEFDKGNHTAAAKRCKIHQRTFGRYLNGETTPTLAFVEAVASGYGLHAWQLLIDGFNPHEQPELCTKALSEADLYDRYKSYFTQD